MKIMGKMFIPGLMLILVSACVEDRQPTVEATKAPAGGQDDAGKNGADAGDQINTTEPDEQSNGSGSGGPNTGGGLPVNPEHLKITGQSEPDFNRGKIFVNSWNGQQDEIPQATTWHVKSVRGSANSTGIGDPVQPGTGGATGGVSTIGATKTSYNANIKAIFDRACISCHSPGGSRAASPLNSYLSAKTLAAAATDRILNGTMPPGGALSNAEKEAFKEWKTAAYPENTPTTTVVPGTPPGTDGNNSIRTFRIPAGTGSGAWNTVETEVKVKIGVKFVIYNDDTVTHQWHTNGSPCPHGQPIPPGGKEECTPNLEFNSKTPLYDHISNGKFYIKSEK